MLRGWPGKKERVMEPVTDLPVVEGLEASKAGQGRGPEVPRSVPTGGGDPAEFRALEGRGGRPSFRPLVPMEAEEGGQDRFCLQCLKRVGAARALVVCENDGCDEGRRGEGMRGTYIASSDEFRCLTCSQPSSRLVCPDCRASLPSLPARDLSQVIALVGLRSSGKTVYLAALLKELEETLGRLGISVTYRSHGTQMRADRYWRELFVNRRLPEPTRVGSLEPLILWLSRRRKGEGKEVEERIPLVLYDPPGEMFEQESDQQRELLTLARGIIALVDVTQPQGGEQTHRPAMVIQHLIRDLERVHRRAGHMGLEGLLGCGVRLAVTLSKVDALMGKGQGYFVNPEVIRQGGPSTSSVERLRHDLKQVHDECRDALMKLEQGHLLTLAENHFVAGYFGVSALGAAPLYAMGKGELTEVAGAAEMASEGGPLLGMLHPVRVVDPILWLLDDVGFLSRD